MNCLSCPLKEIPDGEWFCEQCVERRLAGGELIEAKKALPDIAIDEKRWRSRVNGIRCCAQLSLCVGMLEQALRLDELEKAVKKVKQGLPGQPGRPAADAKDEKDLVIGIRADHTGFREFLVEGRGVANWQKPDGPPKFSITVPEGCRPGQRISFTPPEGDYGCIELEVPLNSYPFLDSCFLGR